MPDDNEGFENEFNTQQFKASSSSGPAKGGTDWLKDAAADRYGAPIPKPRERSSLPARSAGIKQLLRLQ